MILLSILIPTIPQRTKEFERLSTELYRQISECNASELVQVLPLSTETYLNGGPSTGAKRNQLLSIAMGKYVAFVDDDDMVMDCYISEILKAAETDCDVMATNGYMTTDGREHMDFEISIHNPYALVGGKYLRHPNHLSPIRRNIALDIGFPDQSNGEDYDYCRRLKDSGLCKTETKIIPQIYHYNYSHHNKMYR